MKRAQEKVNDVSGYKATVKSLIERAVIFFQIDFNIRVCMESIQKYNLIQFKSFQL